MTIVSGLYGVNLNSDGILSEGKANVDNSIYSAWCARGIDLW